MSALPAALATWGPELDELAPDLLNDLQPWLLRLASSLGPLKSHHQRGEGPPDGFDGLTRKGPYARLLGTEWLLAEHYPDEFLRRAAQAEHLFYDLATEVPAGRRSCVVLFDAGPEQWGAPRILQLALLITLARRARLANVDFAWGLVQDKGKPLVEDINPQSALRLLEGRAAQLADEESVQRWRDQVGALDMPVDEMWWVGGPTLRRQAPSGQRWAEITEPLSLSERRVSLRLGPPHAQELSLQLPSTKKSVRLLRNPFEVQDVLRHSVEGGAVEGLLFSVDGRTLYAWGDEGLSAHVLPTVGSAAAPPLSLATQHDIPVAVGRARKRHMVVLSDTHELSIVPYSKRGTQCEVVDVTLHRPRGHPAGPEQRPRLSPCIVVGSTHAQDLLILDTTGFAWRLSQQDGTARVLSCGVTGVSRSMGGATMVICRREDDESLVDYDGPIAMTYAGRSMTQQDLPRRGIVICDADSARRIVHLPDGDGDYRALFSQTTVAVRVDPDEWYVQTRDEDGLIKVPTGHTVMGPMWARAPGLVTLAPDSRTVHVRLRDETRVLCKSPIDLSQALISPRGPVVAYRTPQSGFRVEDLISGRALIVCTQEAV